MITSLLKMEEMANAGINFGLDTVTPAYEEPKDCYQIPIPCELLERSNLPHAIQSLQFSPAYEPVNKKAEKTPLNFTSNNLKAAELDNWITDYLGLKDPDNEIDSDCLDCLDRCGSRCKPLCSLLSSCNEDQSNYTCNYRLLLFLTFYLVATLTSWSALTTILAVLDHGFG
jgi:hypothetical protein